MTSLSWILLLSSSLVQTVHGFTHMQNPVTINSNYRSNRIHNNPQDHRHQHQHQHYRHRFSSQLQQSSTVSDVIVEEHAHANGEVIDLPAEISRSFLQYSLSIILGRALPDARDGLKPVHRRILFAASQLGLAPSTPHRKCARVVGEVLGKWHPHGDQAVYDALVRMAQVFATNHPLLDGHGNFGSVDNDPAAAMRYTECRLTTLSQTALLASNELHPAIVPFLPNFDGTEQEPTVLPSKLPLLILNGSSGIAVGMATNIPPHNLREVMTACIRLLEARMRDEQVSDKELLAMIPAPDFPTGALLLNPHQGAKDLYTTGNGGIVMRAVTHVEKITVGKIARTAIIVTELPYQTNKSALLEKIAALVNDKRLDGIADLRDESDRDGIRIVLELKRDAVAAVVLNNLFKKTPLQTTFSGNFVALLKSPRPPMTTETMDGSMETTTSSATTANSLVPQRLTLRVALDCFLDFRFDTIRSKSRLELQTVQARDHIVKGLLLALENIDAVIDIIRQAPDAATAKQQLIDQILVGTRIDDDVDDDDTDEYDIDNEDELSPEPQADAILRLQLGQLTRLNKDKLEKEQDDLAKQAKRLTRLLKDENAVYKFMQEESKELMDKFGTERKSRIIVEENGELQDIDLVKNSRSVIVVTRGGYIKRMPLKVFESQGRGTRGKRGTSDSSSSAQSGESDESEVAHCFTCNDHDTLLMVTQRGIAYGLRAYQVPTASRTAKGQPIPSVLPVQITDVVTAILPVSEFSHNRYLVLATERGSIKKTPLKAFENLSSRGLTIATLDNDDRLNWCHLCQDGDDILIGSTLGKATRFDSSKLRPTGRTSRGVKTMKLREDDSLADMNVLSGLDSSASSSKKAQEYVLAVTAKGFGKRLLTSEFRAQARGGVGVIAMKFKNEYDRMSCLRIVQEDDEILVITAKGIIVRQKVSEIPSQSRTATGVRVQRVDIPGDQIKSNDGATDGDGSKRMRSKHDDYSDSTETLSKYITKRRQKEGKSGDNDGNDNKEENNDDNVDGSDKREEKPSKEDQQQQENESDSNQQEGGEDQQDPEKDDQAENGENPPNEEEEDGTSHLRSRKEDMVRTHKQTFKLGDDERRRNEQYR